MQAAISFQKNNSNNPEFLSLKLVFLYIYTGTI